MLLQLARELRREVHPLGVTGGQVALLVAIRQSPGIGVRDLAAREGVSAAAMSRQVARLTHAGLVRRVEGQGGDRRRVGLELTEDAERVLRLVRSRRTAWLTARLAHLDEHELAAIEDAIEPLRTLLADRR